jgi:hypothetical protein
MNSAAIMADFSVPNESSLLPNIMEYGVFQDDAFDRADLRQDFLLALPPPFPLDPPDFRIRATDGPIRWDWTKEWQGFSQDAKNFLVKDGDNHFPHTQDGPLADYQRALNDLDAAIAAASILDWTKGLDQGSSHWTFLV